MKYTLRIVDWNQNFENNRTRELKRMDWVPVPVKHDGDGYTELMDHKDGAAHFGCWIAILQVAAKCDPRGTLLRDGARPHDPGSLGRMTRIPAKVMSDAIDRLISVGWIERISLSGNALTEMSHDDAVKPQGSATECLWNGMEWNGMERKSNSCPEPSETASEQNDDAVPDATFLEFPVVGKNDPTWSLTESKVIEYESTFQHLDVRAELRKALQWCRDNKANRKTSGGMLKFLNGWLSRSQNRGTGAVHGQSKPTNGTDLFAGLRASREAEIGNAG